MEFVELAHRYVNGFFQIENSAKNLYQELKMVLTSISDEDIINKFNSQNRRGKSISEAINKLIDERLVNLNWSRQSPIFKDPIYDSRKKSAWTLDFAKQEIAVEVAFNHGGNIAWNLIKPVLSSELNHVEKAIQTKIGIIITATENLIFKGGFDNAVGSFEKFAEYLKPLNDLLVTPMMIIGLKAPKSFYIQHQLNSGKKTGIVVRY